MIASRIVCDNSRTNSVVYSCDLTTGGFVGEFAATGAVGSVAIFTLRAVPRCDPRS